MKDYFIALLEWCKVKVLLWDKPTRVVFKEGEIWWCSIGMNAGEETFGKGPKLTRPVLIFKKFTKNSFLGLPLTGYEKEGSWYVPINMPSRKSSVMLNQARIFDGVRLRKRITSIGDIDFKTIKKKFKEFYCP